MLPRLFSLLLLSLSALAYANASPAADLDRQWVSESAQARLPDALSRGRQLLIDLAAGTVVRPKSAGVIDLPALLPSAPSARPVATQLPGTWRVTVPGATPAETFYALQTFNADGTFVETSSLLGTLVEGPAHGVWAENRGSATLTFELFAFADDGTPVGRIRVRAQVLMRGPDRFLANSIVDLFPFDGEPLIGIGSGSFTAERLPLVAN